MRGRSICFGWVFCILGLPAAAPAQADPIIRAVPATGIGTETLGEYLRALGHAPKPLSPDVFQVTVERDRWPVHVMLSLSTDGQRIWMESKFAPVEDPDQVSPAAWRGLLTATDKIAPAHFTFDPTDRRVHLYKSFENRAATREKLGKELDQFDRAVRKTQEYWKGDNFKPTGRLVKLQEEAPSMTIPPVIRPEAKAGGPDDSTKLVGEWRISGIEVKGRKTPEKVIEERKPTLDIQNSKTGLQAKIKTGLAIDRVVTVKLNALTPDHKHIDFVDENDQTEKGVYQLDGDTLTVCFAALGEARPRGFKTTEDNRNWLLVLTRAKK